MDEQAFLLYSADFPASRNSSTLSHLKRRCVPCEAARSFLNLRWSITQTSCFPSAASGGRTFFIPAADTAICFCRTPLKSGQRSSVGTGASTTGSPSSLAFRCSSRTDIPRAAATSWSTSLQSAAPTRRCSGAYPLRWLGTSCTAMTQRRFKNSTASTQTADVNAKSADVQTAFRADGAAGAGCSFRCLRKFSAATSIL